jgi:hypothetical protein
MRAFTRVAVLLIVALLVDCRPLLRTNLLLKDYVGKPIDQFVAEQKFAYDTRSAMQNGGAVYGFHGGPGGPRCEFYIVTDARGIIASYRFENC